jgi:hypothetical protein
MESGMKRQLREERRIDRVAHMKLGRGVQERSVHKLPEINQ